MKLYVTKRAEPDRRLKFVGQAPPWMPLFAFGLVLVVGTILFWAFTREP